MFTNIHEYHQMKAVLNIILDNWSNYFSVSSDIKNSSHELIVGEIYYMNGLRFSLSMPTVNKNKLLISINYYVAGKLERYYHIELDADSISVTNKNNLNNLYSLVWHESDTFVQNDSIYSNHVIFSDEFKKYYNELLENVEDIHKKSISEITNDEISFKEG